MSIKPNLLNWIELDMIEKLLCSFLKIVGIDFFASKKKKLHGRPEQFGKMSVRPDRLDDCVKLWNYQALMILIVEDVNDTDDFILRIFHYPLTVS